MANLTETHTQQSLSEITRQGLVPNWPAPKQVRAFCSSRFGGVSQGPYASLNLGDHVGDCPDQVTVNRTRLCQQLQCPPIQWLTQVHGTACLQIEAMTATEAATCAPLSISASAQSSISASAQALTQAPPPVGDALWARTNQRTLAILTADCMPILMCDHKGTQVCALHAGWRGLAAGIIENTLNTFYQGAQVMIWLGPAIGPKAFEVGPEVKQCFVDQHPEAHKAFREKVSNHSPLNKNGIHDSVLDENLVNNSLARNCSVDEHLVRNCSVDEYLVNDNLPNNLACTSQSIPGSALAEATRYLCDLYELARLKIHHYVQTPLNQNALTLTGIYADQVCTMTDTQRWFSHRRQAPTGRMASLIWLAN